MLFKKEEKPVSCYLQVRVKESEKEALKEIADKYNMTLTDLIKEAVGANSVIETLRIVYENVL